MNFNTFSFHPQINAGISRVGYKTPTPIQTRTIPPILEGSDVLGLAQTGTGKTAAFVLPMLQHLMKGQRGKLRALILAPTRELAEQTHAAIKELGGQTGLRSISVYGGVSANPQIRQLRNGVDIVVACPGRLLDLKNQGVVDLRNIEILILDEADQMFDMGFLPDIKRIISAIPQNRQTLLFSATMPVKVHDLVTKIMDHPVTIEIDIAKPIDAIDHAIYPVNQVEKLDMLLHLLEEHRSNQVLVFTRTKRRAAKLAVQLSQAGVSSTSIQGNLSQSKRQAAMNAFRKGKIKVLVATDIAARGIDVMEVSHVINYDVPDTAEAYTHRTGRTGRMDQPGTAFSLVTQEDLAMVHAIERNLGKSLERRRVNGFETTLKESKQVHSKNKNSRMSRSKNQNRYRPAVKHN
ncbi:MAG: DEAD/DEAH box helicase [Brevefilum sp.]